MKALILDGSKTQDKVLNASREAITKTLKGWGWKVETLLLHEMDIAPCLGCFGCWVKTPGTCVIKDAGREIPEKIVRSDLLILLTPITFGGHSPELKRAMDRAIPMLLPFFRRVDGETHHVMRYESYPKLVAIGSLTKKDEESEKLFERIVLRNAINYDSPKTAVGVVIADQPRGGVKRVIEGLLKEVEVKA